MGVKRLESAEALLVTVHSAHCSLLSSSVFGLWTAWILSSPPHPPLVLDTYSRTLTQPWSHPSSSSRRLAELYSNSHSMLAAIPPPQLAPMTEYIAVETPPTQTLLTEDRSCPGCKKSVVDENGGVVVAFG
ncbi:hypothetical protein GSI_01504 [Ganoderma sinense ZZ0214-1]|uniref:Uncharacterized protein n=1 Tax=Ganoderma sinense ZZ0214-1 TaxID=1077348 RepID=A0A2G8SQ06_9APHY|nr:hypothetical protein GSI_01504 [Ganoderma sinense ZZ0214-1]